MHVDFDIIYILVPFFFQSHYITRWITRLKLLDTSLQVMKRGVNMTDAIYQLNLSSSVFYLIIYLSFSVRMAG